jgi:hypothetical protein
VEIYNRMVFQATLETAILGQLREPPAYLVPVYDAVKAWAMKAMPVLITKARKLAETYDGRVESVNFYSMTVKYHFSELADKLAGSLAMNPSA